MALSYTQMNTDMLDSTFINRVQIGLLQIASNVMIQAEPPPLDGSLTTQRDTLGRNIITRPAYWAVLFAPVVAVGFFGRTDLTENNVSDADIFSRIGAIYDQFLGIPG